MLNDVLRNVEPGSETETDKVNEVIARATATLTDVVENHSGDVRPHEAEQVLDVAMDYAVLVASANGPENVAEHLSDLLSDPENCDIIRALSPAAIGNVLMQALDKGCDGEIDKHLAVDVSSIIGPDHAQTLYRFAVLVTKLA